eukprot:g68993.t1
MGTTSQADEFVRNLESVALLTGLLGKADYTFCAAKGNDSLLDYIFCSLMLVNNVENYVTWPYYFIPFSDHKLVTVDVKIQKSNSTISYFSLRHEVQKHANFFVHPVLKELRKKKLELLRQLTHTKDRSDRKKIVVELKEFNLVFKDKLKELQKERKDEDLRQVVAEMKANPRKAWAILRRFLGKESDSPRQI